MLPRLLPLLLAAALAACSGTSTMTDDDDAGRAADAGSPGDAGGAEDAGTRPDAGDPVDAGTGADGGSTDAGTTPDAGPVTTPFGGDCEASFPGTPTNTWRHEFGAGFATAQGGPNHRVRDPIVTPGTVARVRGRFTYGAFDKDLEDEDVELWLRRCPAWEKVATLTTNHDGIVWGDIPGDLPKGEWSVRFLVLGDGTTADGIVAVWPAGTQAIVTDVDGTLTTSDWQAVQDVLLGADAEMYPDGDRVMHRWAAKGYRLLYLTGRPQAVNRYSRSWLVDHGFPRAPVQLTDGAEDVLPTDSGVREFKGDRLKELRAQGVEWRAAYGNATTDIGAYADAQLPKTDSYIIGPHAGEESTQAVESYGAHLPKVDTYPDAVQP